MSSGLCDNNKNKKKRLGFIEFKEYCEKVFKKVDKDGKRGISGVPEGCEVCESTLEWDCENCMWRENSWKYDEIQNYVGLARAMDGGMDLNRIKSLDIIDYQKVSLIKEFMGLK